MLDRSGFADPIGDAQTCFRAVLDAMARPGTLHRTGIDLVPPAPLCPAAAAVLLTLIDQDAPVALDPQHEAAREWLAFHAGARFTAPEDAAFAFATDWPGLDALRPGSHEAPEDGATLVLQVGSLGTGRQLRLRGPGIETYTDLGVAGLPHDFPQLWAANRQRFPQGVDLVLCAGTALAALPRTVYVEAL